MQLVGVEPGTDALLLAAVVISLLVIEAVLTMLITPRLVAAGYGIGEAIWYGSSRSSSTSAAMR